MSAASQWAEVGRRDEALTVSQAVDRYLSWWRAAGTPTCPILARP
jgi:hypothetical protein